MFIRWSKIITNSKSEQTELPLRNLNQSCIYRIYDMHNYLHPFLLRKRVDNNYWYVTFMTLQECHNVWCSIYYQFKAISHLLIFPGAGGGVHIYHLSQPVSFWITLLYLLPLTHISSKSETPKLSINCISE